MSSERMPLIEVALPVPVETAWSYLRDPELIGRWFGWDYDGLDAEIRAIFLECPTVDSSVSAGGAVHALEWNYDAETGDRFELLPARGDACRLRVYRWTAADGAAWDDIAEGWITFVQQLRFTLARHPDAERKTLFLAAPARAATTLPLAQALGLEGVAAAPAGAPYEAATAPGDILTGTVWFRTPHQLGLTVDGLHDGLLILTEKPAAVDPPFGSAMIILSAHGAGVDGLASLAPRWEAWWQENVAARETPLAEPVSATG